MDHKDCNKQWATRPDQERFWNVDELKTARKALRAESFARVTPWAHLEVVPQGDGLAVVGETKTPASITHWGFSALSSYASAPADYLRTLSADTAAKAINESLRSNRPQGSANVLIRANGTTELRAIASERYARVWDDDFLTFAEALTAQGWMNPPAWAVNGVRAKACESSDTFDGSLVKVGDKISPSGVYASDRDVFVFLVDPSRSIQTPGGRTQWRGIVLQNSEVRAGACKASGFLFDTVCGNHNLFGYSEVFEMNFRHVGDVSAKLIDGFSRMQAFAAADLSAEKEIIDHAAKMLIAENVKDVIDVIYSKRSIGATRGQLESAQVIASTGVYGDPRTPWAVSQAMTQLSQSAAYAADRVAYDRTASKVLAAF